MHNTEDGVRNNYRPEHPAKYAVNQKADAAYEIYEPYLVEILQNKTEDYEERGGITYKGGNFGAH